jgi:hypothetical protein
MSRFENDSYESMKEQITMRVINKKMERRFLGQVPHRKIEDLAIVYQVIFQMPENEKRNTLTITNTIMEKWGINEQELHEAAMRNTKEVSKPVFSSIESIIDTLMEDKESVNLLQEQSEFTQEDVKKEMFVLTSENKVYGATMMLYPEVLSEISEIMQGEYYILPSSIHELIIVSKDAKFSPKELGKMVREINRSQVEPKERLSDRVYEYSKETKNVQQVMESIEHSKERER